MLRLSFVMPMKHRRMSGLDLIQFTGLIFIIAFISRYSGSGPSNHAPASVWVILVVGVVTLALMWLTAVRARE